VNAKAITVSADAKSQSKVYGSTSPTFLLTPKQREALLAGNSFVAIARTAGENVVHKSIIAVYQALSAGTNYTTVTV
jgi:hypothetical protein